MTEFWKGGIEQIKRLKPPNNGSMGSRYRRQLENTYTTSFNVPFPRDIVFQEVAHLTRPLGLDMSKVQLSLNESWGKQQPPQQVINMTGRLVCSPKRPLAIDHSSLGLVTSAMLRLCAKAMLLLKLTSCAAPPPAALSLRGCEL